MSEPIQRRAFLKGLGAGSVAAAVPSHAATPAPAASAPVPQGYTFLTPPEAAFVEAAVNQFVPADELTPNGTQCGLAVFIDRQLAGAWGSGDRLYMQGPWRKGTPSQGYQLPLTPAEFFRAGLAAANAHCTKTYQKEFDRLTSAQQTQVLKGLENGSIVFEVLPAKEFFELLLATTMQGFFADPLYGGNRDKAAWKMIGYPGVIAVYSEHIKNYRNRKYDAEPVSIPDLS